MGIRRGSRHTACARLTPIARFLDLDNSERQYQDFITGGDIDEDTNEVSGMGWHTFAQFVHGRICFEGVVCAGKNVSVLISTSQFESLFIDVTFGFPAGSVRLS